MPIKILPPGGEWTFALLDASWTIQVDGLSLDDVSFDEANLDKALERLNGQTLMQAEWRSNNQLLMSFGKGARVAAGISQIHDSDSDMGWLLQTHGVEAIFDGHGILKITYPK